MRKKRSKVGGQSTGRKVRSSELTNVQKIQLLAAEIARIEQAGFFKRFVWLFTGYHCSFRKYAKGVK